MALYLRENHDHVIFGRVLQPAWFPRHNVRQVLHSGRTSMQEHVQLAPCFAYAWVWIVNVSIVIQSRELEQLKVIWQELFLWKFSKHSFLFPVSAVTIHWVYSDAGWMVGENVLEHCSCHIIIAVDDTPLQKEYVCQGRVAIILVLVAEVGWDHMISVCFSVKHIWLLDSVKWISGRSWSCSKKIIRALVYVNRRVL